MSAQPNRRQFIRGAAIAASAALVAPAFKPFEAQGQVVATALSFAEAANPLLAFVALVEGAIAAYDGIKTKTQLNNIAAQVVAIAGQQESMLHQLADMRIVMREEIKRGFLDNDARELEASAETFKVALVTGDKSGMSEVARDINKLTFKLGGAGLATAPAYLDAIALQNSVHYALQSPAQAFQEINNFHATRLNSMLNGRGENSLAALRDQPADNTSSNRFDDGNLATLKNQIGRIFLFATVSTKYQPDENDGGLQPASTHEYGVIYNGIKNGKIVLDPYHGPEIPGKYENNDVLYSRNIEGKKKTGMDIWFQAVKVMAGDYKDPKLKGLLPYEDDWFWGDTERASQPVNLAADGKGYLTDDQLKIVNKQIAVVANYYANLYDERMGPNITQNTRNPQPAALPSDAYSSMRTLLEKGLDSVNRVIVAARNGQLYSAATTPDSSGPTFVQAVAHQNRSTPAQPAGYFHSHSPPQQPAPQQRQPIYPYGYAPSGTGTP